MEHIDTKSYFNQIKITRTFISQLSKIYDNNGECPLYTYIKILSITNSVDKNRAIKSLESYNRFCISENIDIRELYKNKSPAVILYENALTTQLSIKNKNLLYNQLDQLKDLNLIKYYKLNNEQVIIFLTSKKTCTYNQGFKNSALKAAIKIDNGFIFISKDDINKIRNKNYKFNIINIACDIYLRLLYNHHDFNYAKENTAYADFDGDINFKTSFRKIAKLYNITAVSVLNICNNLQENKIFTIQSSKKFTVISCSYYVDEYKTIYNITKAYQDNKNSKEQAEKETASSAITQNNNQPQLTNKKEFCNALIDKD